MISIASVSVQDHLESVESFMIPWQPNSATPASNYATGAGQSPSGLSHACPARRAVRHRLWRHDLRPKNPRSPPMGHQGRPTTKRAERQRLGRLRRQGGSQARRSDELPRRPPCRQGPAQTDQSLAHEVLRLPGQSRRPAHQQHFRAGNPTLGRLQKGDQRLPVRPDLDSGFYKYWRYQ